MKRRVLLLCCIIFIFTLACTILGIGNIGGDGAGGAAPKDVVTAFLNEVAAKNMDKAIEYVCKSQKDQAKQSFDFAKLAESSAAIPGMDPTDLVKALKIEFQNLVVTEKDNASDKATVHVSATLKISIDKEILKTALTASGMDAATIDTALQTMGSTLEFTQPMDSDLQLIQEDGKWAICPTS